MRKILGWMGSALLVGLGCWGAFEMGFYGVALFGGVVFVGCAVGARQGVERKWGV